MRALLITIPAFLLTTGCTGPDMEDYCGDPAEEAANWEDGSEATAAELRDGLLGLWEGTASFEGVDEPMTLVINDPTEDPALITYPDAGEGYDNVSVSDACLDTLLVRIPTQLLLDDSAIDLEVELELHETGFSGGWTASQDIALASCSTEPCALHLSFERYNTDSDEIIGKLRWVDTTVDDDGATGMTESNVSLTRVME